MGLESLLKKKQAALEAAGNRQEEEQKAREEKEKKESAGENLEARQENVDAALGEAKNEMDSAASDLQTAIKETEGIEDWGLEADEIAGIQAEISQLENDFDTKSDRVGVLEGELVDIKNEIATLMSEEAESVAEAPAEAPTVEAQAEPVALDEEAADSAGNNVESETFEDSVDSLDETEKEDGAIEVVSGIRGSLDGIGNEKLRNRMEERLQKMEAGDMSVIKGIQDEVSYQGRRGEDYIEPERFDKLSSRLQEVRGEQYRQESNDKQVEAEKPLELKKHEQLLTKVASELGLDNDQTKLVDELMKKTDDEAVALYNSSVEGSPKSPDEIKQIIQDARVEMFTIYNNMTPDQWDEKFPVPEDKKNEQNSKPMSEHASKQLLLSYQLPQEGGGYKDVGYDVITKDWKKKKMETIKQANKSVDSDIQFAEDNMNVATGNGAATEEHGSDNLWLTQLGEQFGDKLQQLADQQIVD